MQIRSLIIFSLAFSSLISQEYTLDNLCQKGIENNPKIKSFIHKTSASKSYYDQSIDRYKPQLSIDGQLAHQQYTLEYTTGEQEFEGLSHQYQFSLKQPVYRATLLSSITDAKERIMLAKLFEEDEKAKLITQILQNTFELIRLKKTIQILTQKENILKKAYKYIKKSYTLKLASKVEEYQSLSMLKKSQSDLVVADQMYKNTLFNLKMLTKIDDVEKYIEKLNFNINAVKKTFNKINIRALKSQYHYNTRLELERQTVRISEVQIDLRAKERYPNIDAVISYGDSGGTLDATVRQDDTRAMLTLNFPIYQGGYVSDRVEEARYLKLSAEDFAEDMETNIKISLEKKIQDISSGIESINAESIAVQASKKYFEAAIASYRNGLGSLTDAYLAEADYYDNRLSLVNSESSVFSSLAEVYYYSGKADFQQVKELQKRYFK